MIWYPINKKDTFFYKGLAILMIVLHNFMHVFPSPRQNEFDYDRVHFDNFLYILTNKPENILQAGFSYFGHFGVQVFIFLSAYGLTKKYFDKVFNYKTFVWNRLIKIYPAFFLALFTWGVLRFVWYWYNGTLDSADFMVKAVLLKIFLLSNFFQGYALKPVGPWWFFPFIIQFYLVYPLILKFFEHWGLKSLILVSILAMGVAIFLQNIGFGAYYTILPYLPSFCLGIYLAVKDKEGIQFSKIYLLIIFVIFMIGNFYKPFWYLTHFCALILLIVVFQYFNKKVKNIKIINSPLTFMGAISMQIFFSHGFLRTPLVEWAIKENTWFMTDFYCLLFVLFSIFVAFILFRIEDGIRKFL